MKQLAVPTIALEDRPHWGGEELNEPGLSLTNVTVPNGNVGLPEVSVTVAVQMVRPPTLMDPGLHERDVVVE